MHGTPSRVHTLLKIGSPVDDSPSGAIPVALGVSNTSCAVKILRDLIAATASDADSVLHFADRKSAATFDDRLEPRAQARSMIFVFVLPRQCDLTAHYVAVRLEQVFKSGNRQFTDTGSRPRELFSSRLNNFALLRFRTFPPRRADQADSSSGIANRISVRDSRQHAADNRQIFDRCA